LILTALPKRASFLCAACRILPMLIVLQVEVALILLGRTDFLWAFALAMAVVAIVLLRMGFSGFSREALLARDVGLRNPLRRALRAVRASFETRPGIFRLIWMRRTPMLLAAAGLPFGALAGYLAGASNAIPSAVMRPVLASLIRSTGEGGPIYEVATVFSHNVLAFLLVAVLAITTAGLSGFLLP